MGVPLPHPTLRCADVAPLLTPFVDGELLDDAELRAHLAQCARCDAQRRGLLALKAALRGSVVDVRAPDHLVQRITNQVRREDRVQRARAARGPLALVVGGIVVVVALSMGLATRVHSTITPTHAPSLLASSLQRHATDLPVDVASSDPRRVEEFLRARAGFSFAVPRLQGQGFALIGGRLVDVSDRPGAHLVYRGSAGQRVSVMAVKDPDGMLTNGTSTTQMNGVRVHVWRDGDTAWSLVADLDQAGFDGLRALVASN